MNTSLEAMKELIGEHEAILAYMHSLTKSAENLAAQPVYAQERLQNYRYKLYDFKDTIWYHLEVDERIFKSLFGDTFFEDPVEEHLEIQRLVDDMILLADNTVIEKMEQSEVNLYCEKLGTAFNKICKLIQLHIAKENMILEQVQGAMNRYQV